MPVRSKLLPLLFVLSALFSLAPATAVAQSQQLLQRRADFGALLPPTSIAVEQSVFSLGLNPAGLVLAPGGIGYLHEEGALSMGNSRRADALYASLGGLKEGQLRGLAFGAGLDWLRGANGECGPASPCIRRGTLALALGSPQLSLGVAWHHLSTRDHRELDGQSTWDLGFVFRPARWVSLGGLVSALNAPKTTNNLLPRLYTLGLGLRPFGKRLTLAADYAVDDEQGFQDSALSWLATVKALRGLEVMAQVSHPVSGAPKGRDVTAQLALRGSLGLLAASVGGGTAFGGGQGPSVVVAAQLLSVQEDSLFGPLKVAHVLDLAKALAAPGTLETLLPGRDKLSVESQLVLQLQRLRKDPSLGALVLRIRGMGGLGMGRIEELRGQIFELRRQGVPVLAVLESGGDAEYYLACAAERIVAAPQSLLAINGLGSERFYLRGLLDKIGVKPEFVKAGAYKSAPEQFERTEPSSQSLENTTWLLDDHFARYVAAIAQSRKMEEAQVKALLNVGLREAHGALAAGLIDGLAATRQELEHEVSQLAQQNLRIRPAGPAEVAPDTWGLAPAIGLIEIRGNILPGKSSGNNAGAETLSRDIAKAAADPRVKALVVRVESPGGDVTASELIYSALLEAKERKPVVVSMGDVAASGGYYVALGGTHIMAEPGTLTGSIGVFAGKVDASELMEKVGVSSSRVQRGEQAGLMSLTTPWNEREREVVQSVVDRFYAEFIKRVANNRSMSLAQVESLAGGRVWTGAQALKHGLVDSLGGLPQALALARELAGLPASTRVSVQKSPGLFDLSSLAPLPGLGAESSSPLIQGLFQRYPELASALQGASGEARRRLEEAAAIVSLLDGRPLAIVLDPPLAR